MGKKFFTSESFNTLITEIKKYADAAASKVKNDLLNGAGGAYDTLKELGDLIDDNHDAIDALETVAAGKADKEHKHTIDDIEGYVDGGQGGSSVQSDWDQNDETALDYIKNKPFYKGDPIETVLLEETTLDLQYTQGDAHYNNFEILSQIEADKKHVVMFDGTQYECIPWYYDQWQCYVLGNSVIVGLDDAGNNEPFFILVYPGYGFQIGTISPGSEHTLKISCIEPNNKTLDVEFLPKHLQFGESDPVETILLEETTVAFGGDEYGQIPGSARFIEGEIYTVVFDGVTYECEAWVDPGYGFAVLGNASIIGMEGGDANIPFFIDFYEGDYMMATPTYSEHTISISGIVSELIPLDEKFISYKPGMKTEEGGEIFNDYVNNTANYKAHAEGESTTALGMQSHAEGCMTTASGHVSHAEGYETTTAGFAAHAEGESTTASGDNSHAEGIYTTASEYASHAEGDSTIASGHASHAEGEGTIASATAQHVQGMYNIEDSESGYLHIVGNGHSPDERSNAHTLDWDGNAWFAGNVYVGGTSQDDASELALKSDLESIDLTWEKIKDKPFGDIEGIIDVIEEREIMPLNRRTFETNGDSNYVLTSYDIGPYFTEFNPDKIYKVNWDGVDYYSKVFIDWTHFVSETGIPSIGSKLIDIHNGKSTKCPFNMVAGDQRITIYIHDGRTHTFSITECSGVYTDYELVTLDPKYLPEHLQFGKEEAIIEITNEQKIDNDILPERFYGLQNKGYFTSMFVRDYSDFDPNKFYRVIWDGVEYYCTAFEDLPYYDSNEIRYAIGSPYVDVVMERSEYPFNVYFQDSDSILDSILVTTYDSSRYHTLHIYECTGTYIPCKIKTIDAEYLPEHLQFGLIHEEEIDITSERVIAPSKTIDFVDYENDCYVITMEVFDEIVVSFTEFDISRVYKVIWDDVTYYCPFIKDYPYGYDQPVVAIGSPIADIISGNSEYPFNMYYDDVAVKVSTHDGGAHTISIIECTGSYKPEIIKKIDPKFLPEMNYGASGSIEEAKAYTDSVVAGKADKEHTHAISEVTDLQTALDSKAPAMGVAYIDENDNETVVLTINLPSAEEASF